MIQATITGNISDPKCDYTRNGIPYLRFSIASTEAKKNQQTGQWEETSGTTWIRVTIWDHAEDIYEQLRKGQRLTIAGKLCTETYTGRDGQEHSQLVLRYPELQDNPPSWNTPNRTLHGSQRPEQAFDTARVPQTGFNASTGHTASRATYTAPAGGSPADPWAQNPTNDKPPF